MEAMRYRSRVRPDKAVWGRAHASTAWARGGRCRARSLAALASLLALPCAAGPRLEVDSPRHDFGARLAHETIEHTFMLANRGRAPLTIHRVGSGCGCTVVAPTRSRLDPGETVPLPVRVPLASRRGRQRVTVLVETDDPQRPRQRLVLEGVVDRDIEVRPARVYFDPAGPRTRPVEITLAEGQVERVESDAPWLAAELQGARAGVWPIVVSLSDAPPQGELRGRIRAHTSHPRWPHVDIGVRGRAGEGLIWAPAEIVLAREQRDPISRAIVIRTTEGEAVRIVDVQLPAAWAWRSVALADGTGVRLILGNLTPEEELAGRVITVETTCRTRPRIDVPVRLVGKGLE